MNDKKLRIIIDKAGEIDNNGILFTESSISFADGQIVPVFKSDYKDEEKIGMVQVKFEDGIKSLLVSSVEFDKNFDINELVGKNLAPRYIVQNEDIEKIGGITYIRKVKLESVSVITNTHASGIKPITKKEIEDAKEK